MRFSHLLAILLALSSVAVAQQAETNILYSFENPNQGKGSFPYGSLIIDASGNLYGTTPWGLGNVFELVNSSGVYSENVLSNFAGSGDGDGANPYGGLITDSSGNLYGTTFSGGSYSNCTLYTQVGCGTVFELVNSSGTYSENVLYSFAGSGGDGANSYAGLIMDTSGNLYGTTFSGGSSNCSYALLTGCGTVFELVNSSGAYTEKVLYTFTGSGGDGANPYGGLLMDASGNLYGTTSLGGSSNCSNGCGTVFELVNSSGTYSEKVLYNFTGVGGDGAAPLATLIMDDSGNLYGTTNLGGLPSKYCNSGCGTAFELVNSSGTYSEKVLYVFTGYPNDGYGPDAGLIMDASGNLYGTTYSGGASPDCSDGCGTVFVLVNSSGTYNEKVLHSFSYHNDGANPIAGLIMDASGNLYGTTEVGGITPNSFGTAFEVKNGNPSLSLSAVSLSFSNEAVNTTSAAKTVTLKNGGSTFAYLNGIAASANFAVSATTCGATLAPAKTCKVSVTFTPTHLGAATGTLTFTDNASDSPQTAALSGTGINGAALTPSNETFPKTKAGTTSAPKTFTLANDQPAALTSIVISTSGNFAISATTCGTSLAVKGKCTVSVTFTPTATGTRTGQLIVSDSAGNSPQTSALTGTSD